MARLVDIPPVVDEAVFRSCLRRMSSHVCVITAEHDGSRNALTATAVTSVTADPPQLLVCIHHTARAGALIQSAGFFAVNMLSMGQSQIAKLCATSRLDPEARFGAGRWFSGPLTGMPLLESACANFECRLESVKRQGTHYVIFGLVIAAYSNLSSPLLFHDGKYASLHPALPA